MENKTLTATCANPECGKRQSTEMMVGVSVGRAGHWRQITICKACADAGWHPDAASPRT
jgi:hypothetical protein